MINYLLFVDGSVNPKLKIGFGVYLLVSENNINDLTEELIKDIIKIKKFENTSSTRLEIENLLWALTEAEKVFEENLENIHLKIYSDSQNIIGLQKRRERFEKNDFKSLGKNEELKNADLYRDFFRLTDKLNLNFIKVAGHSKFNEKDFIDKIFTIIDRTSRKALRLHIKEIFK